MEKMSSPFEKRLMDLTAYLIEMDSVLKVGETKGLNYADLIWDIGYTNTVNNREYIMVAFRYQNDSIYRVLVALQKEKGFSAFIRESSPTPFFNNRTPKGKVVYKSLAGLPLLIENYEYGKMLDVSTNTELNPNFQ